MVYMWDNIKDLCMAIAVFATCAYGAFQFGAGAAFFAGGKKRYNDGYDDPIPEHIPSSNERWIRVHKWRDEKRLRKVKPNA